MTVGLDAAQTKALLLHVGEAIVSKQDVLTEADSVIGDGDHGIGMSLGFTAADERSAKTDYTTVNDVFRDVGTTLMATMGGASGVIFGTMVSGGVKGLAPTTELTTSTFATIMQASLAAIKVRAGSDVGGKTMIDALQPAVGALGHAADAGAELPEAASEAAEAAKVGMEATKGYPARYGRARSLGERALGHPDPGAVSVSIIFDAIAEWLRDR